MRFLLALLLLLVPLGADATSLSMAGGGAANAAGGGVVAFSTWDPTFQATHATYSNGNRTATFSDTSATFNVRGTNTHLTSGSEKVYFEMLPVFSGSPCCWGMGIMTSSVSNGGGMGNTTGSVTYESGSSGNFFMGSNAALTLAVLTSNTVVAWAFDFGAQKVWVKVGCGGNWNNTTDNPATNTGGISLATSGNFTGGAMFLGGSNGFNNATDNLTINVGATAFTCTPPTGFVAWH